MRRGFGAAIAGAAILTLAAALAGAAESGSSLDEAALLGPPAGSKVEGAELDARTRALAERMRCPVCQGLSIADSPSASALAMLSQVRDLLGRGYTEEQVLDYFVRSYGEFVLLQPTAIGFNLVVWLLPLAGVLTGAGLIALRLRAARRRAGSGADAEGANGERVDSAAGGGGVDDPDLEPYLERVRSEVGP